jgi:hypothetical protein
MFLRALSTVHLNDGKAAPSLGRCQSWERTVSFLEPFGDCARRPPADTRIAALFQDQAQAQ